VNYSQKNSTFLEFYSQCLTDLLQGEISCRKTGCFLF
jgi:hypothetical protein